MAPTVLITGATRGLGLAAARAARERGADVLCAGPDPGRTRAAARSVGATPVVLDLARLDRVRAAVDDLPPVDALAANAGIQLPGPGRVTADGFEATFQVNHLAHLALVDALLARGTARVVLVGSQTHDPAVRTGTPPPDEGPVAGYSRGGGGDGRAAGLRRYTTSKLLAVATTAALAREHPDVHVTCLDPGLMPGTGLGRGLPAPVRALARVLAPAVAALPFASTPAASGRALAALLCDPPRHPSGTCVDHRLRPVVPSVRARDRAYQDAVLRDSRALLGFPH